ncbi:hypothetical protein DMA15_16410 [Streptomyces sp. WAC 01529]|uniref:hypothetical protein n=1 Tax=Streptomyces sp. WAC 01529 TaxID=2203205 RepID=UPI000F6CA339|nr:hypothetical protein [Streptomyces sp. WAC 01529]AZM53959.1 hypothetical protein DMA15_16410 [Streptomyces sp. WAC 01529]
MPTQLLVPETLPAATAAETTTITALMAQTEAPLSGAPVPAPEAGAVLILLALLSPGEPKEPREK